MKLPVILFLIIQFMSIVSKTSHTIRLFNYYIKLKDGEKLIFLQNEWFPKLLKAEANFFIARTRLLSFYIGMAVELSLLWWAGLF